MIRLINFVWGFCIPSILVIVGLLVSDHTDSGLAIFLSIAVLPFITGFIKRKSKIAAKGFWFGLIPIVLYGVLFLVLRNLY